MRLLLAPVTLALLLAGCADRGAPGESTSQTQTNASATLDGTSSSDSMTDGTGPSSSGPDAPPGPVLAEPVAIYNRTQRLVDVPTTPNPFEHGLTLPAGKRHIILHFAAAGPGSYQLFLDAAAGRFYSSVPRDAEGDPDSQGDPIRFGEAQAKADAVTLRVETSGIVTYTLRLEVWSAATLQFSSPSFADGGEIPLRHACGDGTSPPLTWSAGPAGSAGFALFVEDLDIPGGGSFPHWWVRNIPSDVTSVAEGLEPPSTEVDSNPAYYGPCPPAGETHRYLFKIFALDALLPRESGAPDEQLPGHVLAYGFFVGTFRCPGNTSCA